MDESTSIFPNTQWTLIDALRDGTEAEAKKALDLLGRAYWQPLYVVARGRGLKAEDAEDLVQGFFYWILKREALEDAEKGKGQLRGYLHTCFENFRVSRWKAARTLKRGAGKELVSFFSASEAEERYLQSLAHPADVETLYNREWARSLLARAVQTLRNEMISDHSEPNVAERVDTLIHHMTKESVGETSEQAAERLDMTSNAFRMALFRLRKRFAEVIRSEIIITLGTSDEAQIHQEMLDLMKAFQ